MKVVLQFDLSSVVADILTIENDANGLTLDPTYLVFQAFQNSMIWSALSKYLLRSTYF